jgi:hypothetical protein
MTEEEEEKITIEIAPFTALSIMTLLEVINRKIPPEDERLKRVIEEYIKEVVANVSIDQINQAMVEAEIFEAMSKLNKR